MIMKLFVVGFCLMLASCQSNSVGEEMIDPQPKPDVEVFEESEESEVLKEEEEEMIKSSLPVIYVTSRRPTYYSLTDVVSYDLEKNTSNVSTDIPYEKINYNKSSNSFVIINENDELPIQVNDGSRYDIAHNTTVVAIPHQPTSGPGTANDDHFTTSCYALYVTTDNENWLELSGHVGAYILTSDGEKLFYVTASGGLYEYEIQTQLTTQISENVSPKNFTNMPALFYNEEQDALLFKSSVATNSYEEISYLYHDKNVTKLSDKLSVFNEETLLFTEDYLIYLGDQTYTGDVASIGLIDAALYIKSLTDDTPPIKLANNIKTFDVTDEKLYYVTTDSSLYEVIDEKTSKLLRNEVQDIVISQDIIYEKLYVDSVLHLLPLDENEKILTVSAFSDQAAKDDYLVYLTELGDLYVGETLISEDVSVMGYADDVVVYQTNGLQLFYYDIMTKRQSELAEHEFSVDEVWVNNECVFKDSYYLVEDESGYSVDIYKTENKEPTFDDAIDIILSAYPGATLQSDPFYQEDVFNVATGTNEGAIQLVITLPEYPDSIYIAFVFSDSTYQVRFAQ